MSQLKVKGKVVLGEMRYLTNVFAISKGLMLSFRKKCERGVCLVMPSDKDVRYGAAVTMFFCFCSLEIIFVNSKFKVVDKVILKPWHPTYVPKKKCKYVIEAYPGRLESVKVGNKVEIRI